MKIGPLVIGKDGGTSSTVDGVMFEIKSLFSVGVLRFKRGSREAFHSHAFNCWSVLLKGCLVERFLGGPGKQFRTGAIIKTKRSDVHKVVSFGTSYVLTFRGPWADSWLDVEQLADVWRVNHLKDGRRCSAVRSFGSRAAANSYAKRYYS